MNDVLSAPLTWAKVDEDTYLRSDQKQFVKYFPASDDQDNPYAEYYALYNMGSDTPEHLAASLDELGVIVYVPPTAIPADSPKATAAGAVRSKIGHNLSPAAVAARNYLKRLEALQTEMVVLRQDMKTVFDELKGDGFDPTIFRLLLRERAQDPQKMAIRKAMLEELRDLME